MQAHVIKIVSISPQNLGRERQRDEECPQGIAAAADNRNSHYGLSPEFFYVSGTVPDSVDILTTDCGLWTMKNSIKVSASDCDNDNKPEMARLRAMTSRLKPCPHCRRKVRLSQKTARQRRQSPNSATIALFCNSRTFFCDKLSHFSATLSTGFNIISLVML